VLVRHVGEAVRLPERVRGIRVPPGRLLFHLRSSSLMTAGPTDAGGYEHRLVVFLECHLLHGAEARIQPHLV
jgi:hypothetical protein